LAEATHIRLIASPAHQELARLGVVHQVHTERDDLPSLVVGRGSQNEVIETARAFLCHEELTARVLVNGGVVFG
jgi:hypothetical protein